MRRLSSILLLTILSLSGCVEPLAYEEPKLYLRVVLPDDTVTKSESGDPLWSDESVLKNLHVWVFRHENGQRIGYKKFTEQELKLIKSGMSDRWYLTLTKEIAQNPPQVDVFALANYNNNTISLTSVGNGTTRAALQGATVKGFGTSASNANLLSYGLPYSAVKVDIPITGNYPILELEPVVLQRAVSKITFLSSQVCVNSNWGYRKVNDFSISNLTLDANQIRSTEYLFNDSSDSYKVDGGFDQDASSKFVIDVPSENLALNPSPETYTKQPGESVYDYGKRIQQAVQSGLLTRDVYYLRESDQRLQGTFTYSIGGVSESKSFIMAEGEVFARNLDWIVYIYFLADEIHFSATWVDWLGTNTDITLTPDS